MELLVPNRRAAGAPDHPEYFEGQVALQPLRTEGVEVIAVWFDGGARNKPHIHSTDQLLYVVSGRCLVATRTERRELGPGGMASIPAGEWHWHGAPPGASMCHLSIKQTGPTDWTVPLHDW